VRAQVAAIPSAAQQGRELAGLPAEHVNDGSEFLGEQKEAAIGDGLLIAQGVEDGVWGGAGGRYAARSPERVGFGEEAGDLAPASSFASLARFADENDEEIEAVARGSDAAVCAGPDEVAESGQELEKDGCGIGLGVRRKCADEATCDPMESRSVQRGMWGRGRPGVMRNRRLGFFDGVGFLELGAFELLFLLLRELLGEVQAFSGVRFAMGGACSRGLTLVLVGKQLSTATVYVSKCRQPGGKVKWVWSECHALKLPGF
jgi:hypothetical protein